MLPRKNAKTSTPVQSIKHKDKRANIPTEELRDFVADDEKTLKTLLYPRDPSLDPSYGIKFGSNWQVSTCKRDVKDGKAEDATRYHFITNS